MKSIKTLLYPFVLLIVIACNGQNKTSPSQESSGKKQLSPGYEIDPSIEKDLVELDKDNYLGNGEMDIKATTNGKEIPLVSTNGHPCYSFYTVKNDTFSILVSPVLSPGNGIRILIHGNNAEAFYIESPRDGGDTYKYKPDDSSYVSWVEVKAASGKVILKKLPEEGVPIEGVFVYEGEPFYQKAQPSDSRSVINAKGRFIAKFQPR